MSTTTAHHTDTLIIGAGISGIGMACRLRQEFPDRDFAILERRNAIGGTWDLFRYPGIRSDSDMFTFGYDFRPWDELNVLADGASIRSYVTDTAKEFGVDERIKYGVKVLAADWSSADQAWTVTALREATGDTEIWTCSVLVTATGYYNHDEGYLPEFPGSDTFQGTQIHPQHWPEDLDYTGKKVVIIGSGATAITLVPAMAEAAEHVTMLQRSPSYIFSLPAKDKITAFQRRFLPRSVSYKLTRARNIATARAIFKTARRFPGPVRSLLLGQVKKQVGDGVDMAHFSPTYGPWDQRLCACPDGDFFKVLRDGTASIVTDTIETFTPTGIKLTSGQELEADIIITATGLAVQLLGGATLTMDGEPVDASARCTYKGVMLEGVPNLMWVFGYTNLSWTTKVGLTSSYLVRLVKHMDAAGTTVVVPEGAGDQATDDMFLADKAAELSSGYLQRGAHLLPRQGRGFPWRTVQDYRHDKKALLSDPIDDGVLTFEAARAKESVSA
jgi:cation diffusion facilitator CzcD-associated flavoprotein CzcO